LLYRLEYWQATSKMILTYGWTGVGLGNFQSYYPQFKLPAASEIIADPHNIFLDLAANCSVPFLLIICIACSSLLAGSAARLLQQPLPLKSPTGELKTDRIGQTQDHAKPMVRWIWLGGICGLIGAILLQLLLREAVDAVASLLGATLAAVVVPFVIPSPEQNARWLRSVALAAVAAMFICLMTTGSWQASGIAFPLLAWLALATPAEKPCVIRDRRVIVALRAGLALLLIAFVMQTWRPVHSSWAAAQSALAAIGAKDWNTANQLAQDSQAADRLDPTAYRLLVQIRVEQAAAQLPDQFSSAAAAVQQAIDRLLACDPAGPGNWSFAAEQMLSLASLAQGIKSSPQLTGSEREARRASGQAASAQPLSDSARALVERAVDYGQQAVLRYPSSVALHVQRGVGLALLGKHNEAREELEQAVQLSAKTPHVDRQLGSQQIWLPADLNVFPTEVVIRPTTGSSWVQAEPLCEYLRTNF
jgi:tetratricopeptide (TPR) repeat protein